MWIMSISLLFLSAPQDVPKFISILIPVYPILQTRLSGFGNRICPANTLDSRDSDSTCSAPRPNISSLSLFSQPEHVRPNQIPQRLSPGPNISDPQARFQRGGPDMSGPRPEHVRISDTPILDVHSMVFKHVKLHVYP
jgi:hypothetical protein